MKNKKYIYFILFIFLIIAATIYFAYFRTKTVVIVSSLPAHSVGTTRGQLRGIQLALESYGYRAGRYKVEWQSLDNSDEAGWNLKLEKRNAEMAVINSKVVAYYGPFNSGSAIASLPILNKAGMLQLSGSMTWPGLTKTGYGVGEPMIYYPTGARHFYRVVPNDSVQGLAAASFLKGLGVKSAAVIHDNGVYGIGVSSIFSQNAKERGIQIKYSGVIEGNKTNSEIVKAIVDASPDAIFFGSEVLPGISETYSRLRQEGYSGIIFGTDFVDNSIEKVVDNSDNKFYTIMPGKMTSYEEDPSTLSFYKTYKERFNENPSQYASYANLSIRLILDAIEKSDGTRNGVLSVFKDSLNIFNNKGSSPIFDTNGDILVNDASVMRLINRKWNFEQLITI